MRAWNLFRGSKIAATRRNLVFDDYDLCWVLVSYYRDRLYGGACANPYLYWPSTVVGKHIG
jgi:hypothetical protein